MMKLPVQLQGKTRRYRGNGRKLGYPTANISADAALADGVYFGFADIAEYQKQPALIFIGKPVTVGDTERRVEAHVLDIPDVDYYDSLLTLSVQYFHRPNQKFASVDDLKAVMARDEIAIREWLRAQ